MGELIHIGGFLKEKSFIEKIKKINDCFLNSVIPSPQKFGWQVEESVDGIPIRYSHHKNNAFMGYCEGEPEFVYLEYKGKKYKYFLSPEELSLGLEFGTLPDAEIIE